MSTLTASNVRLAIPSDEEGIVSLLRMKHEEDGLAAFDEEKVRAVVERGIVRQMAAIGVVRGKEIVEGAIGIYVGEWWYSRAQHFWNPFLYVHPDHRRTTHAKSLLQFAKGYATDLGIPLVAETITSAETAQKEKLYERELPKRGALFIFNAPQLQPAA